MNKDFRKFQGKDEQPSLLCFSDTMNRRPLPTPPGNETLTISRLDDDSQLKEFEKLLQTSKNKDISGYIEEESMSFTHEGLGRFSRRKGGMDELNTNISKLAGIVLAFGEKIDRVERRLGNVEIKIGKLGGDQGRQEGKKGWFKESKYKAHTISSNMKHRQKKRGTGTIQMSNNQKQDQEKEEGHIRTMEIEIRELKMKNKSLKIDKGIIMKMIKNMIEKFPENVNAIDHELFLKTLDDQ